MLESSDEYRYGCQESSGIQLEEQEHDLSYFLLQSHAGRKEIRLASHAMVTGSLLDPSLVNIQAWPDAVVFK